MQQVQSLDRFRSHSTDLRGELGDPSRRWLSRLDGRCGFSPPPLEFAERRRIGCV